MSWDERSRLRTPDSKVLTWADVATDDGSTPTSPLGGTRFAFAGIAIGLHASSDPGSSLLVGIDEPGAAPLAIGDVIYAPVGSQFTQVYLKRPSTLASDSGRKFVLTLFWDPSQAKSWAQNPTKGTQAIGKTPNIGQTATTGADQTLLAANTARKRVKLVNLDTAGRTIWVNFDAAASATKYPILPLGGDEFEAQGAVHMFAAVAGTGPMAYAEELLT